MKQILLSILVLLGLNSDAQYYSHLYGENIQTIFNRTSGINTFGFNYGGHAMASEMPQTASTNAGALVVLTDVNGNPIFNNVYTLYKNGFGFGDADNHIFEWNYAQNLGVVGLLDQHNNEGIYYLQLDPSGNVLGSYEYVVSPTPPTSPYPWYIKSVNNICESADGLSLYITGMAARPYLPTGTANVYILKIDIASGAMLWSQIYDFAYTSPSTGGQHWPYDIVESPFSPSGTLEVAVVGNCRENTNNPGQPYITTGFFLRVDGNNGFPLADVNLYGAPSSAGEFRSIIATYNMAGGSNGFILAGHNTEGISMGTGQDVWSVKVDQTGNSVLWQNLYSTSHSGTDHCYDLIERINPSTSQYEYYYGGQGNFDVLLLKTDDMGNVFPNGEMQYKIGDWSAIHTIDRSISQAELGSGLSSFGTSFDFSTRVGQTLALNTYFNLVLGCGENIATPLMNPGPGFAFTRIVTVVADLMPGPVLPYAVRSSIDHPVCFNPFAPGGSNARVAPVEPGYGQRVVISPNPMEEGAGVAMIELETEGTADVQVSIYDLLGKQYYKGSFIVEKGNNRLPLDVGKANMAAGMYTVKVSGAGMDQNVMLLIK